MDLATRFWAKVDKSGECWLWTAGTFRRGYGAIKVDGKQVKAHRLAHELFIGPIPEGLHVLHRCDVPGCVRPEHLYAGTDKDNVRDRSSRKRGRNDRKTHCPAGHAYDETNTRVRSNGWRECRTCHRLREAARVARLRSAA